MIFVASRSDVWEGLGRVEDLILKDHAEACVESTTASGDANEQRQKFTELVELMAKVKS